MPAGGAGRQAGIAGSRAGSLPRNRYPPPGSLSAGKAFVWVDRFLDQTRVGPLWLRDSAVAALVVDAIRFGERELGHYELGAFVVMPNHVHVLVTPRVPVPKLTRRLKGYTAREASRFLNRTGEAFWQGESYDHWVRSAKEWTRIAGYIERNPVTAGLRASSEDYPWSSAAIGVTAHRQDCRCGRPGGPLHSEGFPTSEM